MTPHVATQWLLHFLLQLQTNKGNCHHQFLGGQRRSSAFFPLHRTKRLVRLIGRRLCFIFSISDWRLLSSAPARFLIITQGFWYGNTSQNCWKNVPIWSVKTEMMSPHVLSGSHLENVWKVLPFTTEPTAGLTPVPFPTCHTAPTLTCRTWTAPHFNETIANHSF